MEEGSGMKKQASFTVRDVRKKEQFIVDDLYLNGYAKECGIYSTGVYVALCRHADKNQESFPTAKTIADKLGISTRQVFRALETLEKMNIISRKLTITKKGFRNIYCLLDQSAWKGKSTMTISHSMSNSHGGYDCQSHGGMTNSRKKDSHIKYSQEGLSERLLELTQKFFPSHRLQKSLPVRNLDYFLQLCEAGRIRKEKIENPTAYIRSLTPGDDYISYPERQRKREEQAREKLAVEQREREKIEQDKKEGNLVTKADVRDFANSFFSEQREEVV